GCGQHLLSALGEREGLLKVPLKKARAEDFEMGQEVVIGIAEQALLKASGTAYIVPLLSLLLLTGLGQYWAGEAGAIGGALVGILLGAAGVAWYSRQRACVSEYQPQLLSTGTNSAGGDPIKLL
ncbi:MAG: SoxR reducing system RseC family protein, partial [Cellvibrionaceae bacterium]|nr:SoxR reducing system RseC family protein [Cellvibrionaceae bacterium]